MKKVLTAIVGLTALVAITVWQFYLFVVFKDSNGVLDTQGGTLHFGLAVIVGLLVCVAGLFLISSFVRQDGDEINITSRGTL